ncbi:MAG: bifunctional riboflavin kinase/FAD synthetase [Gemmataceae bacterium]|nr:bifunctional riboflavin kinase/FAD synthetase [Gemmataceae bacterium]
MGIERFSCEATPPANCRDGAVAIGNFDGVHRGHASLLAELRRRADAVSGPAVAISFDPHPLQLLNPARFQPVLTTPDDRAALLLTAGADRVVLLRTTTELLALTALEFFNRVIRDGFRARALVEGDNFGFGRNREGNIDTLRELCKQAKIDFAVVPPFEWSGVRVSSSRVRNALLQGDVRGAADLLGRPYQLRGTVSVGQKRGRTLGFPTANLECVPTLIPADGVYAASARHADRIWPAAVNVGPNPTFAEQARKIEAHLIGFQGDLYGQGLAIDFVQKLRDTRPFAGVHELVEQLRRDVEQATQLANETGRTP